MCFKTTAGHERNHNGSPFALLSGFSSGFRFWRPGRGTVQKLKLKPKRLVAQQNHENKTVLRVPYGRGSVSATNLTDEHFTRYGFSRLARSGRTPYFVRSGSSKTLNTLFLVCITKETLVRFVGGAAKHVTSKAEAVKREPGETIPSKQGWGEHFGKNRIVLGPARCAANCWGSFFR